jgi:hypothetical protein
MTEESAAPRVVQAAGLLVGVQGLAGFAVAGGLLVGGSDGPGSTLALAAWFAGCGAALLAVGVNLARGRRGARTPAVVAQILLLGSSWYAAGPSSQPAYGIPAALYCAAVLVLLFCPPAVRWATGHGRSD